jgi:hypothetical protein
MGEGTNPSNMSRSAGRFDKLDVRGAAVLARLFGVRYLGGSDMVRRDDEIHRTSCHSAYLDILSVYSAVNTVRLNESTRRRGSSVLG